MKPFYGKLNRTVLALGESETLKLNAAVKELQAKGLDVANLTAGELDFPTPPLVAKAVMKRLRENKYTHTIGLPQLREKLSEKINRQHRTAYGPWETAVTSGAKSGLFFAFGAILNPGDEVIIPVPSWVSYENAIVLWGGKTVFVPLKEDFDLDPAALVRAITKKTKAIVLNFPHNPTGKIFSPASLKRLAAKLQNRSIYVIYDAIYSDLVYRTQSLDLFSLFSKEQLIYIHGLSKSHALTGWRIGFVAASEPVIFAINKIQSHASGNASLPAQHAALHAVNDARTPKQFADRLKKRRALAAKLLSRVPRISFFLPDGAFYFFIDIRKTSTDSSLFCARLLKQNRVALVPGEAFHAPGFVRLSFAAHPDILKKGIARLKDFIVKLSPNDQ